jgi:hypothetical protein
MARTLSGRRWPRASLIGGVLLLFVVGSTEAKGGPGSLAYDAATGTLTAAVQASPASELLLILSEAAALRVRVRGDIGTVRAQSFEGLPLDVAIQRLFRSPDRSLVMLYEAAPDGGQRLAEVRLSPRRVKQAPQPSRREQEAPPEQALPTLAGLPPPPLYLRLPPPPPPPRRQ